MKPIPEKFAAEMRELLGNSFVDYLAALSEPPVRGFRVNTDKISPEDFDKINPFGRERIPYVENGFYLDFDRVGSHPYHHAGMIYVQEPAAMAPVECLDIQPDWKILDMCAAPGGKSTQLKNKLGSGGVLMSNEVIPSRCRVLSGNIERLGLQNVITCCLDTAKLADLYGNTFDLVTVDAPCSGEGMFRKDETAIDEWSEENVNRCAERQAVILDHAARTVKRGGYILYATCTFSLQENEMTVNAFLQRHPEFELEPVKDTVRKVTADGVFFDGCRCTNIKECRRFYPHLARGEGQFMALLHSQAEPMRETSAVMKREKADGLVIDFLSSILTDFDRDSVFLYNGKPVMYSGDLSVNPGAAFSLGVTVGEIKKNYLQPHHQFFMAMGRHFRNQIELEADSEDMKKYLHGEEIVADCDNGWAVVTTHGCALGGVKVSSGRCKNHYPKGLRTKY
ncbi:MAG: hypothetical protein ACI4GB_04905 [Acutalibacteraceae bacterium]